MFTRSRLATSLAAGAIALCVVAAPAWAGGRAHNKEVRGRTHATSKAGTETRSKSGQHGARTEAKNERGRHHRKPKFVKLTSLVATVDGVSVDPAEEAPRVKAAQLHRPTTEAPLEEAQAAGPSAPATSSGGGMLGFLIVALLLASLAAWLIRQVGPLRE